MHAHCFVHIEKIIFIMELLEKARKLQQAEKLILEVIETDLREDIIWLSHARHSKGFVKDAITELEKALIKGERKYKEDQQIENIIN